MANKRMFTKKIVDSDAFLDMPLSARCLYYDLCMRADDDGFVGNPKRIARMIGASVDDLKILIGKRFLLTFENGVIVIKHWRMHNTLQKDRYAETQYTDEKSQLLLKSNGAYSLEHGNPIDDTKYLTKKHPDNNLLTECSRSVISDIDIDLDKELDLDSDKDLGSGLKKDNSIAQSYSQKAIASEPLANTEAIILNTGEEWKPKESDFEEYKRLYPGVDVLQAFREMRAWCINNPQKRKTIKGVKRFVGNWLSKAQDEATRLRSTRSNNSYIDAVKNRVSEVDDWV